MVFNTVYFMGGGVSIEYLEKQPITKVMRLYNRCVRANQRIKQATK